MRIKRSLPIVIGVLGFALAITLIVQLRKHAPPEPARLLPGADAFFYVNLKWVRTLNAVDELPSVYHEPEYEQFVAATDFQFERDLDQAAFAVHYPDPGAPKNKDGSPALPHFSEVFVGKIRGDRLRGYLRSIAHSVDNYRSVDIFNIPLEGRTVRVAILGVDTVAVSNHDDPGVIRGIVERSRKLASPFGGPALLRQYYKDVPLASLAWAIARVQPTPGPSLDSTMGSLALIFSKPAVLLISARYLRALHLKAEAFTDSPEDAQSVSTRVETFLNLFHSAEGSVSTQGTDPDVKAFFESLKVEQTRNRAVLTATVPPGFVRKALASPDDVSPLSPPAADVPQPASPAPKAATPPKRAPKKSTPASPSPSPQ